MKQAYNVKGIAITGSTDPDDPTRGEEAGFVQYLIKPILPELARIARQSTTSYAPSDGVIFHGLPARSTVKSKSGNVSLMPISSRND